MVNHDNLIIEELSIKDSNLIGYKFLTVTQCVTESATRLFGYINWVYHTLWTGHR